MPRTSLMHGAILADQRTISSRVGVSTKDLYAAQAALIAYPARPQRAKARSVRVEVR
ncbi:hypothetical protein NSND_63055 [Nitrospira sp. ND1]|nr:hypothetical protein NSND_63055 [Nitrospira sp. ND1]